MTTLTIDLPGAVYERLRAVAEQQQTTVEAVAQGWLAEKAITPERERLRAVLRAAGKLVAPSTELQQLAAESTLTLSEARAMLDRTSGKPLSEIILEMRGPKE
jgi:hypothetical protein